MTHRHDTSEWRRDPSYPETVADNTARSCNDGVMQEDAAHRARQRADEARQRAREAGARAAELASGPGTFDATSLARSKQAVERAAHLAVEGYRHAAEAELSAARTHDSIAESLEKRCEQDPADSQQLRQQAADHRASAADHRRKAQYDESSREQIDRRGRPGEDQ